MRVGFSDIHFDIWQTTRLRTSRLVLVPRPSLRQCLEPFCPIFTTGLQSIPIIWTVSGKSTHLSAKWSPCGLMCVFSICICSSMYSALCHHTFSKIVFEFCIVTNHKLCFWTIKFSHSRRTYCYTFILYMIETKHTREEYLFNSFFNFSFLTRGLRRRVQRTVTMTTCLCTTGRIPTAHWLTSSVEWCTRRR